MSDYKVPHDNATSCLIAYNDQMRQLEEKLNAIKPRATPTDEELRKIAEETANLIAYRLGYEENVEIILSTLKRVREL